LGIHLTVLGLLKGKAFLLSFRAWPSRGTCSSRPVRGSASAGRGRESPGENWSSSGGSLPDANWLCRRGCRQSSVFSGGGSSPSSGSGAPSRSFSKFAERMLSGRCLRIECTAVCLLRVFIAERPNNHKNMRQDHVVSLLFAKFDCCGKNHRNEIKIIKLIDFTAFLAFQIK
jgi:hypothetical protein